MCVQAASSCLEAARGTGASPTRPWPDTRAPPSRSRTQNSDSDSRPDCERARRASRGLAASVLASDHASFFIFLLHLEPRTTFLAPEPFLDCQDRVTVALLAVASSRRASTAKVSASWT